MERGLLWNDKIIEDIDWKELIQDQDMDDFHQSRGESHEKSEFVLKSICTKSKVRKAVKDKHRSSMERKIANNFRLIVVHTTAKCSSSLNEKSKTIFQKSPHGTAICHSLSMLVP